MHASSRLRPVSGVSGQAPVPPRLPGAPRARSARQAETSGPAGFVRPASRRVHSAYQRRARDSSAGAHKKPLGRYDPSAPRNRLREEALPHPVWNKSQIRFGPVDPQCFQSHYKQEFTAGNGRVSRVSCGQHQKLLRRYDPDAPRSRNTPTPDSWPQHSERQVWSQITFGAGNPDRFATKHRGDYRRRPSSAPVVSAGCVARDKGPLEPYNPDARRNRLATQPPPRPRDFVSQISIGDTSLERGRGRKSHSTSSASGLQHPRGMHVSHAGIIAFKTKWQRNLRGDLG